MAGKHREFPTFKGKLDEREAQRGRENLIDPGPLAEVDEAAAEAARKALRDSTPDKSDS